MLDLNSDVFMVRSRLKATFGNVEGVRGFCVNNGVVKIFVHKLCAGTFPLTFETMEVRIVYCEV